MYGAAPDVEEALPVYAMTKALPYPSSKSANFVAALMTSDFPVPASPEHTTCILSAAGSIKPCVRWSYACL